MRHDAGARDRRKYCRRQRGCAIARLATEADEAGGWHRVRLSDLSPGGVLLESDNRFEAGSTLTLCFSGSAEVTTLLAVVRVVRAQRHPGTGGAWLLGCRFAAELGAAEYANILQRTQAIREH